MSADVYEKLAQHLDNLPAGFPRTETGVELKILRRLFTPAEAELTLHLSLIEENAQVIARRAGKSVPETAHLLEKMEKKGLVFVYRREGQSPQYQATGYVIGIYEFQLNKLNADIVHDIEEYAPAWFDLGTWKERPQLRTIPVGESIEVRHEVMHYEQAEEIVKTAKKIAVAPCICRQEKEILGKGCGKLSEACLVFGRGADYYIHNSMGREISLDEALDILKKADKSGLVLQPGNSKQPGNICCCCGCCCGVLLSVKRHPKPAEIVSSPYRAVLDDAVCSGCGLCVGRCQMEAIEMVDGIAALNWDRCIGCGLCVTTCKPGALTIQRKPKKEQPFVPRSTAHAHIRLGQSRGKLPPSELLRIVLKSKVDRFLAPKNST